MTSFDPDRLNLFDKTGFKLPYKKLFDTWFYPAAIRSSDVDFLPDDAEVLAVEVPGGVRSYPVRSIQSHHIVQDRIADQEVVVTF